MEIAIAGEGFVDLAVMRRMVREVGLEPGDVLWGEGRKTGKDGLNKNLTGYRAGADHGRAIFVLRDLDDDAGCAPALLSQLGVVGGGNLCLRIAVRQTEAWLIADRDRLAKHLSVHANHLPVDCEATTSPKTVIVDAARRSRSSTVRKAICPRPGSGRAEGPEYATVIAEFISSHWNPVHAAGNCDSLDRALKCLRALANSH